LGGGPPGGNGPPPVILLKARQDPAAAAAGGGFMGDGQFTEEGRPNKGGPAAGFIGGGQFTKNDLPNKGGPAAPAAAAWREAVKKRQTLIRRLERQEGEILRALESLEAEKKALEMELSRPEVYSSPEKARTVQGKLQGLITHIEAKTSEWEAKAAELQESKKVV
jgi:hypothetical protein